MRDAVPIPPLKSWHTIPVPPPTEPSATGPAAAAAYAAFACSAVTWKPSTSLSVPSQVSATTGRAHASTPSPISATSISTSASRTTPTLWVLVMPMGECRRPTSSIQGRPVISPLPLRRWYAA